MYCTSAFSALLIDVTDNLCLEFFNVRFQNCAVVPDRRQDLVHLAATHIDFETQRLHHVAGSPGRCIQIVVRLLPLVQGVLVRFISSMSTIVFMYHIRGASTVFCTF